MRAPGHELLSGQRKEVPLSKPDDQTQAELSLLLSKGEPAPVAATRG